MDYDMQAERLYRISNQCREMTGALRQLSHDLGRMHLTDVDELIVQFKKGMDGIFGVERAALSRMVAEHPAHLMTDLAPRQLEAVAKCRRELLNNLAGK